LRISLKEKEKDISVQAPTFTKYGFRIRTRVGLVVENLMIHGRDESEAQRKLRQMYQDCEILDCICHAGHGGNGRMQSTSFEDVVSLITR
jgi:hypothetical protein